MLLFVAGLICFGMAGYAYYSLHRLYDTFAYYGISTNDVRSNDNAAQTIFNFKFGIGKFVILGTAAWIAGLVFFIFSNRKRQLAK